MSPRDPSSSLPGASISSLSSFGLALLFYDDRLIVIISGYVRYLLTESRSRRVIVVENPFLPDPIKRIIGEVLLDNLQVSLRKVNISHIHPRSPLPSNLSLFSFLYSSLFGFSEILTVELTNMSTSAFRCSS